MSMHSPSEHQDLTPEMALYEADQKALQDAESQLHVKALVGRLKFGLDPAAMMVVPGVREHARSVIESLGTTIEKVWPLVKQLHEQGPWEVADRLKASEDPEIRAYIVLAEACHESGWPGYKPEEYIRDRARVVERLSSFTSDQFENRKQALVSDRLKGFEDASEMIDGKEIKIAFAEGDPSLPLSVMGYKGCVVRAGEMRFAQSSAIPDQLLEEAGYVKGFGELYDASVSGFVRVSPDTEGARVVWVKKEETGKDLKDMVPGVKRIAPGYVLTYNDEALALQLVKEAVRRQS